MADDGKVRLLQVDQLTMGEIPVLERMSGFSLIDILEMDGGAIPMSVLMALAYLTEKRTRPQIKQTVYTQLKTTEFMARLEEKFIFEEAAGPEDGTEDPTSAA